MSTLVAEVLEAWRDAERLLDELPTVHPDHESIQLSVTRLRTLYHELAGTSNATMAHLAASTETLARARALVERTRAKDAHKPD